MSIEISWRQYDLTALQADMNSSREMVPSPFRSIRFKKNNDSKTNKLCGFTSITFKQYCNALHISIHSAIHKDHFVCVNLIELLYLKNCVWVLFNDFLHFSSIRNSKNFINRLHYSPEVGFCQVILLADIIKRKDPAKLFVNWASRNYRHSINEFLWSVKRNWSVRKCGRKIRSELNYFKCYHSVSI